MGAWNMRAQAGPSAACEGLQGGGETSCSGWGGQGCFVAEHGCLNQPLLSRRDLSHRLGDLQEREQRLAVGGHVMAHNDNAFAVWRCVLLLPEAAMPAESWQELAPAALLDKRSSAQRLT